MINCENSLSNLDIFQVDSVFLQRQRRKTKSKLGGILTLLIPIICSIAFALLYVNNSNKSDIITKELINTNTLSYSEQAYIEWNTDVVDVSTIQPFEMITESNKRSMCYQNRGSFTNTEMPICNYGTDLISEPNGVGYVFKMNIPTINKNILPITNTDLILYHENNIVAYVISIIKNEFCIYLISQFQSSCYPYKFTMDSFIIKLNVNKFRNENNDFFFSIYDFINTTYLFKNHKFYSSDSSGFKFYVNETTLSRVNRHTNPQTYETKNVNSQNTTLVPFQLYGGTQWYFGNYFLSYVTNTINFMFEFVLTKINLLDYSRVVNTIQIVNNFLLFNNNTQSLNCSDKNFITNESYIRVRLYSNNFFIHISNSKNNNNSVTFYSCVVVFNVDSYALKSKLIETTYNYSMNEKINRIVLFGGIDSNSLVIYDYSSIFSKTKSIICVDEKLNYDYINDFTNQDNWIYNHFWGLKKTQNDTWVFLFNSITIPDEHNNWKNVKNIGGVVECDNSSICKPLYTTSFNLNNIDENIDLNQIIGQIKINNSIIPIHLYNVLSTTTPTNDYQINVYDIQTKDSDIIIGKVLNKRLYSINVLNKPIVNNSNTYFSNYYNYDNNLLGHDKKFSCIPEPFTNNIYFYSMLIPSNLVYCPIYNYINIPFIFDKGFQTLSSNLTLNQITNSNLTGIFLVNLNPFITKTTITSTKAPFFTIVANTFSVYSVLLTFFMFIKNKVFLFQNKDEITRKNTVINDNECQAIHVQDSSNFNDINDIKIDINQTTNNQSIYSDQYLNDQKNVELSNIRHSHLLESTNQ